MCRKNLSTEVNSRALTMLQCGYSVTSVAADLRVSRQALYDLKWAAAKLLINLYCVMIYFIELETPPNTQDCDFEESPPPVARFKRMTEWCQ